MNLNSDPRPLFARAGAAALAIISQVAPTDLAKPTPCDDFDVEALLGHFLVVLRRARALGAGTNPMAVSLEIAGVAPAEWAEVFAADLAAAEAAWKEDATLDREMTLPWRTASGRFMLSTYASEITVHTWDLARALGVEVDWDAAVVDASLVSSKELLPAGDRSAPLPNGMEIPFDDEVLIAPDAPAIDRLIAWYGRNPA